MSRGRGATRDETSGPRPVGALQLLALGVNGIVGVGIFFAPAQVAQKAPGGASVLVFVATALALAPVALAFATLGRRFGEDGGPVVFARAAFGTLPSFLVGWVAYVSAIASASAVMSGLTASVAPAIGLGTPHGHGLMAAAIVTALAAVCATGIVVSARTWTTLTVLKLVPLVCLVAASLFHKLPPSAPPPADPSLGSWLSAALTATFAYQGFEIVPVIAGQVRSPSRVVPAATLGSLALASMLYVALQAACVAALPGLASSRAPLAEAATIYGGPLLGRLVAAGTSVSALGISLGMMVTTPRYLSALASGESLGGLDRVNARGVPARALGVTWLLVMALIQVETLGELFALSAFAVLTQFVVTAASLAALARRSERGLTPRHAWISVPAAAVGLTIAAGATSREFLTAGAAILLGLALRAVSRLGPRRLLTENGRSSEEAQ